MLPELANLRKWLHILGPLFEHRSLRDDLIEMYKITGAWIKLTVFFLRREDSKTRGHKFKVRDLRGISVATFT